MGIASAVARAAVRHYDGSAGGSFDWDSPEQMALAGALIGGVPGLLWWYLTDEADRNFISQVLIPSLIGGAVGGGIGIYNYNNSLREIERWRNSPPSTKTTTTEPPIGSWERIEQRNMELARKRQKEYERLKKIEAEHAAIRKRRRENELRQHWKRQGRDDAAIERDIQKLKRQGLL